MSNENVNLWAEAIGTEMNDTTDEVIPYMEEQCQQIEQACDEIHARFVPLRTTIKRSANSSAAVLAAMFAEKAEEVEEEPLPGADANGLYNPSTYVFDIYNEKYKFRVFAMELGAVFPITICLDEGIEAELGEELESFRDLYQEGKRVLIRSDAELRSFIRMLIERSRKLRYILRRLRRAD